MNESWGSCHYGKSCPTRQNCAISARTMISKERSESLLHSLQTQIASLQKGEARILAAMQFLKIEFPSFYWVGVYLLKDAMLKVGPYVGPKTDHVEIPIGRGVCGTAVAENKNQIVADVRERQNYLACNLETRSEIVVLVRNPSNGNILGQIDIDATEVSTFDKSDELFLENVGRFLAEDFQVLR